MDDKGILRTGIACARVITLLALLIAGSARAAFFDPFYRTSFAPPDTIAEWTITAGNWQFTNQEFVNNSAGALSIATVHSYEPAEFNHDTIGGDYTLDVYALIASSAANARVGVVFEFNDPRNYHEMNVSATGNAQLRSLIGGVSSTVATATVAAPGANRWIHITLQCRNGRCSVWIDRVRVFANVLQGVLNAGDVGLITRNTRARFDDLHVRSIGREDPYVEDFDDRDANLWDPTSGNWLTSPAGAWTSLDVIPTAITSSPLNQFWEVDRSAFSLPYTFKVRMLNPYGASGNLVGIAWVRDVANYTEAVFSPTGQARLNRVTNGVRTTIASAAYLGGERNRWFEVEVGHDGNEPEFDPVSYIKVNGVPVFDVAPNAREGELSLITHWSPGRFDDVRAAVHFFRPFLEDFEGEPTFQFVQPGTWTISDGTMDNSTIVPASRAFVNDSAGWHDLADIELRARMINRFGGSGNRVGFTYGARGPVYYEAVFSPTGVAHLRKVVKDVPIPIATARYEGGEPGQWFDAQLIQIGDRTTVKVNGITVFDNVPQPDAVGGGLGFVAHWTNASVDNVSLTQIPVTRYRFREMPGIVDQAFTTINAINDRGEGVGMSWDFRAHRTAVLWRNGGLINLGVEAFMGVQATADGTVAQGINNKSEIVGHADGVFNSSSFHWKEGQLRDLGSPTNARDINERGQIAGSSCGAIANGCPALRWEPDGRVVALADLPGGFSIGDGWANNDPGEIVGDSWGSANVAEAVSWQGGTVEPLGAEGTAFDINNRGQIVGLARVDERRAVMWHEGEMIVLPSRVGEVLSLLRDFSAALAINEHGVVVGRATTTPPGSSGATLWQEGRAVDLSELLCSPLPRLMGLTRAADINERGEIAADAFEGGITRLRALILTPVLGGEEDCDR
jgi:uncharacterized membrane protein